MHLRNFLFIKYLFAFLNEWLNWFILHSFFRRQKLLHIKKNKKKRNLIICKGHLNILAGVEKEKQNFMGKDAAETSLAKNRHLQLQ